MLCLRKLVSTIIKTNVYFCVYILCCKTRKRRFFPLLDWSLYLWSKKYELLNLINNEWMLRGFFDSALNLFLPEALFQFSCKRYFRFREIFLSHEKLNLWKSFDCKIWKSTYFWSIITFIYFANFYCKISLFLIWTLTYLLDNQ